MTAPKQFRKKPVVISALKWTGKNLHDVTVFSEGLLHIDTVSVDTWENYQDSVRRNGLWIKTLEGLHLASIGDWIIKGVHGEFYPCKPDIFAKTYEEA